MTVHGYNFCFQTKVEIPILFRCEDMYVDNLQISK